MKITATDYTFDVATTDNGTVTVTIPKNVAVTDTGNSNMASEPYTVTVNTNASTVTVITDTVDGGTATTKIHILHGHI